MSSIFEEEPVSENPGGMDIKSGKQAHIPLADISIPQTPTPVQNPTSIKWRVAIETLTRQFILDYVELSSSDTPTQVIKKMILAYRTQLSLTERLFQRFFLFRRPVIESAAMSCASFIDLEAPATSNFVLLESRTRDDILTHAFHCPAFLDSASDSEAFLATYNDYVAGSRAPGTMPRICVISTEFDDRAFFCFYVLAFLLCIVLGGLAGYVTRSAEVGCASGGGLATVVAGFQVLVWKVMR